MQELPLDAGVIPRVVTALGQSPLFSQLGPDVLVQVAQRASLLSAEQGDLVMEQGEPSDTFFVVLAGEVTVHQRRDGELVELVRLLPPESVGEMGLLLGESRSATVIAAARTLLLRFDVEAFHIMYERIPGFGLGLTRALAARLQTASRLMPMSVLDDDTVLDAEVMAMLPVGFINRHRAVPIRQQGNMLVLGVVDDASPRVLQSAREMLPGMEVRAQRITPALFERALSQFAGVPGWSAGPVGLLPPEDGPSSSSSSSPSSSPSLSSTAPSSSSSSPSWTPASSSLEPRSSPRLDALLRRLVAEGGSDLHISGGQRPRWRIDGEMLEIADTAPLGPDEVYSLLDPVLEERSRIQFREDNDADFAYAIAGVARFRVNVFRDKGGVGAVMRVIPARILTFEQLNLPPVCARLCELPKGLVLVTGPTGSGKSTTLAAMVDAINKTRTDHIITLEDPIEFVHQSLGCMINQREVGPHTKSFSRALRAALREDPDIVLVGEMRDLETVSLAMETANTGHLVFGTLHTATAISTIDRIIDIFPAEQQSQVRAVLADVLKGVVAQTLCKKIGGGRVAALETLVVSFAIANLIREGKIHQVASSMSTSRAQGNVLLNEALATLVAEGKVDYAEALTKAVDKNDLARRCNKPAPGSEAPPSAATPATPGWR